MTATEKAEFDAMKAELARMKALSASKVKLTKTDKGAISLQGVPGAPATFGMTLNVSQVEWLADNIGMLTAFVKDNAGTLGWPRSKSEADAYNLAWRAANPVEAAALDAKRAAYKVKG